MAGRGYYLALRQDGITISTSFLGDNVQIRFAIRSTLCGPGFFLPSKVGPDLHKFVQLNAW